MQHRCCGQFHLLEFWRQNDKPHLQGDEEQVSPGWEWMVHTFIGNNRQNPLHSFPECHCHSKLQLHRSHRQSGKCNSGNVNVILPLTDLVGTRGVPQYQTLLFARVWGESEACACAWLMRACVCAFCWWYQGISIYANSNSDDAILSFAIVLFGLLLVFVSFTELNLLQSCEYKVCGWSNMVCVLA